MTRWYSERKNEFYYQEAKKLGFRARSAFKLQQINNRFQLFSSGDVVIDLGSSPGGWSQVAAKIVGRNGNVIAVDISPMKQVPGVVFIQGDITVSETQEKICSMVPSGGADAVISDMSPNISGAYSIDQARSVWLCHQALMMAEKVLKKGGCFVCKVFEGEDTEELFGLVKQMFQIAKKFSPQASRKSSSELYIVGKKFCGPRGKHLRLEDL